MFLPYWRGGSIKSIILQGGNETYDGELKTNQGNFFFEATCPKDGELEKYQFRHKSVFKDAITPINGVTKKEIKAALKNRQPVSMDMEPECVDDTISKTSKAVLNAIKQKASKAYPENTLLIIAVNSPPLIEMKSGGIFCCEISSKTRKNLYEEIKKFKGLYLVAPQEQPCYKV